MTFDLLGFVRVLPQMTFSFWVLPSGFCFVSLCSEVTAYFSLCILRYTSWLEVWLSVMTSRMVCHLVLHIIYFVHKRWKPSQNGNLCHMQVDFLAI